jgi:hypothetical protein
LLIRLAAALALLAFLWLVFRFAMGLRWAKLQREQARAEGERRGRRLVAELPQAESVVLFLEDAAGFHWGGQAVARQEVVGARLVLNGAEMVSCARPGAVLPAPPRPEEPDGRERWEVVLYLREGRAVVVACGKVREGVSREAAGRVFESVRQVVEGTGVGGQ